MKRRGLLLTLIISFAIAAAHCKKSDGDDNSLLFALFFLNQGSGSTVDLTLSGTLKNGSTPLANYTVASGAGSAVSSFSSNLSKKASRINSTCPSSVAAGSTCATTDSNGAYSITITASIPASATTSGSVTATLGLYDASGTLQGTMTVVVTYSNGGSTASAGTPTVTAASGATVTITASTPTATVTVVVPGTLVLPTCGTVGPSEVVNSHPGTLLSYAFASSANILASVGASYSGIGCKHNSVTISAGTATLTYNYTYDSLDRMTSVVFPSGTLTTTYTMTYKPSSLLFDKLNLVCPNSAAGSQTNQYNYDASNRLTSVVSMTPDTCGTSGAPSSTATATNTIVTYSGTSLLPVTQVSSGTSTSNYTYTLDGNGRVTQAVVVSGTFTSTQNHAYDGNGRITSSTNISGTTTTTNVYTYDGSGRLATFSNQIVPTITAIYTNSYNSSGGYQQILNQTGTGTTTYTFAQ